jgi:hypothetical protein
VVDLDLILAWRRVAGSGLVGSGRAETTWLGTINDAIITANVCEEEIAASQEWDRPGRPRSAGIVGEREAG